MTRCLFVLWIATSLGCLQLPQMPPTRSMPESSSRPLPESSPRLMPLAITQPSQATEMEPDPTGRLLPTSTDRPKNVEPITQVRAQTPEPADETPASIFARMNERWSRMTAFESRTTRREVSRSGTAPTEILAFRYRQKPFSVRFKWIGEEGKGREMLYVRDQHNDKIHVLTAPGDIPFSRGQSRMSFAVDSPLVRARSKKSIRETGFDASIRVLKKALEHDPGSLKVLGPTQRPEYPYPLQSLEMTVAPREDEEMPDGGKRLMYIDTKTDSPSYGLPVIVVTTDPNGREIEYYCFDRFLHPVHFDDHDFDPATLGK